MDICESQCCGSVPQCRLLIVSFHVVDIILTVCRGTISAVLPTNAKYTQAKCIALMWLCTLLGADGEGKETANVDKSCAIRDPLRLPLLTSACLSSVLFMSYGSTLSHDRNTLCPSRDDNNVLTSSQMILISQPNANALFVMLNWFKVVRPSFVTL